MNEEPFTELMKRETRKIHSISDALINAKLGIDPGTPPQGWKKGTQLTLKFSKQKKTKSMSDDRVWADGLLTFYEVFKYLEEAMERLEGTVIEELKIPGLRRTEAFEKDLAFYLGEDWRARHEPRQAVREYLAHLAALESTDHVLLLAYIYHLYMGLLSGGQILLRKRALASALGLSRGQERGLAVVRVPGGVASAKRALREATNRVADALGAPARARLLEESRRVFRLNNAAVAQIPGTAGVLGHRLLKAALLLLAVALVAFYVLG